jgi:hypothetical protein
VLNIVPGDDALDDDGLDDGLDNGLDDDGLDVDDDAPAETAVPALLDELQAVTTSSATPSRSGAVAHGAR